MVCSRLVMSWQEKEVGRFNSWFNSRTLRQQREEEGEEEKEEQRLFLYAISVVLACV